MYQPPVATTAATTAGTAAAGGFAFPPLLLAALLSFAPSLIGKLFGNPQQRLRHQIGQLTDPGYLAKLTGQNYQQALGSPAYQGALGTIAQGANQASNNVAASLAARGIGTTGTGAILSGLTPSLVGSQQAGLRTQAYGSAQSQAQSQIQAQINALLGTQGPSPSQQLFGGGLEAFGPFLQAWLKAKYPSTFAFGSGNGGFVGPTAP